MCQLWPVAIVFSAGDNKNCFQGPSPGGAWFINGNNKFIISPQADVTPLELVAPGIAMELAEC